MTATEGALPMPEIKGQPRVMVVEDERGVQRTLQIVFEEEGFLVNLASNGAEALEVAAKVRPSLVVLDWNLPDISGLEVARRIKEHPATYHTPIILVTGRTSVDDRLSGLEYADDFICKPFDVNELIARSRAVLRRMRRGLGSNPLTGLPGNVAIEEAVARVLLLEEEHTVVHVDLDNFKPFNDAYGYERGDDVLLFTAEVLYKSLKDMDKEWFLGHIGGDDFLFIVASSHVDEVMQNVINIFDAGIKTFYDPADLQRGGLAVKDRRGEESFFPILSITLAAVPCPLGRFPHPGAVSRIAAELKSLAKKTEGSAAVKDRRRD